jgi:hypothetical protein
MRIAGADATKRMQAVVLTREHKAVIVVLGFHPFATQYPAQVVLGLLAHGGIPYERW